jgi:hypothetical protein
MPVGQYERMNKPNEYTKLIHSLRLWLCRTLLRLTRRAYEPYPIAVILRRTADDPELGDDLKHKCRMDGEPCSAKRDLCDLCRQTEIVLSGLGLLC